MILNIKNLKLTSADLEFGKFSENNFSAIEFKVIKLANAWLSKQKSFSIHTSGSTGKPKKIELKREVLEYSARVSMEKLDPHQEFSTSLLCINPDFIGGMMVVIRALLRNLELRVVEPSADPLSWIAGQHYDLVSMVPLQVQTITEESPDKLNCFKTILIGGAPLHKKYLTDIRSQNKTRVFHTYGMTETASHIALDDLSAEKRSFETLGDIRLGQDDRNCLKICGTVTQNEWVQTNDVVRVIGKKEFQWLGRADFVINTGGFKVHPEHVEEQLGLQLEERFIIAGTPHPKLGQEVTLFVEGDEKEMSLDFKDLHPYERPKKIIFLPKFAVTYSGKVDRRETIKLMRS